MKRHGNLYDLATSREALYQAFLDASKHKRTTRSCYMFERRLGAQIDDLASSLANGTYYPYPYYMFWVFEPKPRQISAPAFRDRVVQHAIYNVIRPIFDQVFIDQSFACRIGKGTHAAADYVQAALQKVPSDSYILQLDIRRYYYRIDRSILRTLVERKIKDQRLINILMKFAQHDSPVGVPIGNLLSQLFGLIYLDGLDHFIKRDLGVQHYARYVDDFVLIGLTRDQAIDYKARIIKYLADNLALELSKSSISRVSKGINFVGYRTWQHRRFIRKHSLYTYRKALKSGNLESVVSCLGHAKKTASLKHMLKLARENHADLYHQLPESYRRIHYLHTAATRRQHERCQPPVGDRAGHD